MRARQDANTGYRHQVRWRPERPRPQPEALRHLLDFTADGQQYINATSASVPTDRVDNRFQSQDHMKKYQSSMSLLQAYLKALAPAAH